MSARFLSVHSDLTAHSTCHAAGDNRPSADRHISDIFSRNPGRFDGGLTASDELVAGRVYEDATLIVHLAAL